MGESNSKYFQETCDNFTPKISPDSKYYPVLLDLIKHASHDGIFAEGNERIACNYANYFLNDTLIKSYYLYDNIPKYVIYQNFLKEFYAKKHGERNQNILCAVYIKHIKEDIFKRMQILYKLYDDYEDLKIPHQYDNNIECNKLSKFSKLFNETASTHCKNDSELLTRLTDLKKLIQKKISSPDYNKCDTKINFFYLPEPRPKVQETQDQSLSQANVHSVPVLKSPDAPTNLQEKSVLKEDPSEIRETVVRDDLYTSERSQHSGGSVPLKSLESLEEIRIYGSGTSHESGNFHGLERPRAQKPEETYQLMGEERPNIVGETYQSDYRPSNLAAKEGGASGILSSITGVFESVEPAPILGVYGGMGALFLLFKVFIALKIYLYVYNSFK
ncbi:hypothetical protein PVIIG_05843 [Plasmodium vivax India VII]|uniref:VIR protein n=1 Tax=Plasmodium vivax India VII TaxID=1077284 RepID=A0A0J9SIK5_PLAVI|nr:hypothetical protein PVIIG_05843 [Plasmodium vivax India VII]